MFHTRTFAPAIYLVLTASVSACGGQPPDTQETSSARSALTTTAGTYALSLSIPQTLALRDVAIGAGTIDLRNDTTVSGPRSVAAVAAGTGGLSAGPHGHLATVWSRGDVTLTGANVEKDVHAAGSLMLKAGATVGGASVLGTSYSEHVVVDRSITFPDVGVPADVAVTSVSTVVPGRYGKLSTKPHGEARLSAGRYYFDTIDTAPNSSIFIDDSSGPVEIYVAGNIWLKGDVKTQSGHGASVLFGVFGTSVEVSSATFFGTLIAPSASVRLQGWMTFTGAVFGAQVTALPHVTFVHDASSIFGTVRVAAPGVVGGTPSGSYACNERPLDATLVTTGEGAPYYTDLKFNPALTGTACAPRFCDAANNFVDITEAELNAPPPAGSKCAAVKASREECPLDPATAHGSCTSDLECGAGEICGTQCADKACTTTKRVCAKPLASCLGLPEEDNCQDYWLCPRDGDVTGIDKAKIESDLKTTPALASSALVPDSAHTTLPDYLTLDEAVSTACKGAPEYVTPKQSDGSSKPTEQGSAWGLYFEPTSSFDISAEKRSDGVGEVTMSGGGGVVAGAKVMNTKIEVINANVLAEGTDCGLALTASVKVFGETIVVWTPSAADSFHFVPDPKTQGMIRTDQGATDLCHGSRKQYQNERGAVRKAAIMAKAAKKYYDTYGFTPKFCGAIEAEALPVDGKPLDPTKAECADVDAIPMARRVEIVNAWKNEYDSHTAKLNDASSTWGTSKQKIQKSGVIPIFDLVGDKGNPYEVTLLDQSIPIVGPINLDLAVGGYGSWNVKGGIAYGIGWDGSYSELLEDAAAGSLPSEGDLRMHLGPSVTPDVRLGVWAYAGVGVPGLSVGIEGKLELLGLSVPSEITAALMRVRGPMKDPTGTDWDGTPVPGVEASSYRWITGIHYGSKLNLGSLSGQIDLAARVKLLFFKKTFRQKLVEWKGLEQSFTLVGDGAGAALNYANHTGSASDNVGYPQVDAVTDVKANATGPGFPACASIIK